MTEQKKDFSLLRPFDLEAAKAGAELLYSDFTVRKYIYGPDSTGAIVVADPSGTVQLTRYYGEHYRMAPLCWVEGKPVYKGDKLYWKPMHKWIEVDAYRANMLEVEEALHTAGGDASDWALLSKLTWTPPKVKREGWIAISHNPVTLDPFAAYCSHVYKSEKEAIAHTNVYNGKHPVVHIEWEE